MSSHCAVEVEPGFVFTSGNGNPAYAKQAFRFYPETGMFGSLPDMIHGHSAHGCGVVDKGNS